MVAEEFLYGLTEMEGIGKKKSKHIPFTLRIRISSINMFGQFVVSGTLGKTFRLNVAMKEQGGLVGTLNLASFPGFYRLQHLSLKGGIGLYLE